jgi:hypothetical protein
VSESDHANLPLDVASTGRPALRVEAAGRSLLVVRQGDEPVILARVDDDRYGVTYRRTCRYRPAVPPVRADHAEAVAAAGDGWRSRWAHHFRSELLDSGYGPLHTGRWLLTSSVPRQRFGQWRSDAGVLAEVEGYIEWDGDVDWPILPLRAMSDRDSGRVKAYRKQSRDGILPPVLLWWVSGLDCYLVIDGHDRLAAARAEDRAPELLALTLLVDRASTAEAGNRIARRYLEDDALMRERSVSGAVLAIRGELFGQDLWNAEREEARTRAWPLRGGTGAWRRLVAQYAPDVAAF